MSVLCPIFNILFIYILHYCFASSASKGSIEILEHLKKVFESDKDIVQLKNVISQISGSDIEEYNSGLSNEDKDLNITQLINKYGYHHVQTSDGYVLTLFRIPGNQSAVFLMHGLISSSDDWVTAGPDTALPYLLASEGYDVWMGNARGNKHSRHHVSLSSSGADFWDFSWDEIGRYDLPAMIDYVLNVTSQPQLKYVGHSQGTTSFFVMCSERPEYNEKISVMVSLSSVAWMSHLESPIRIIVPFYREVYATLTAIGIYDLVPDNPLINLAQGICGNTVLADLVCSNIIYLFCGFTYDHFNLTNAPVIFRHFPADSSIKQLIHYLQEIVSGKFRRFDYDTLKNLAVYGSVDPPNYPVEKITAPVAIFYSPALDWFSNNKDVQILLKQLTNVVDIYQIPTEQFSHFDYLWAKDAKELVYSRILKIFQNHFIQK